jgi:hypothetical protein
MWNTRYQRAMWNTRYQRAMWNTRYQRVIWSARGCCTLQSSGNPPRICNARHDHPRAGAQHAPA